MQRIYHYVIDLHGKLYLKDAYPKNIATSYKNERFLKYFYSQMTFNTLNESLNYPFMSLCGKEKNFIKSIEDKETPFVFTSITDNLICGHYTSIAFNPNHLFYSHTTGKLYHKHPLVVPESFTHINQILRYPEFGVIDDHLILSHFANTILNNDIYPDQHTIKLNGIKYPLRVQ